MMSDISSDFLVPYCWISIYLVQTSMMVIALICRVMPFTSSKDHGPKRSIWMHSQGWYWVVWTGILPYRRPGRFHFWQVEQLFTNLDVRKESPRWKKYCAMVRYVRSLPGWFRISWYQRINGMIKLSGITTLDLYVTKLMPEIMVGTYTPLESLFWSFGSAAWRSAMSW